MSEEGIERYMEMRKGELSGDGKRERYIEMTKIEVKRKMENGCTGEKMLKDRLRKKKKKKKINIDI